jgi:hypothetical protein
MWTASCGQIGTAACGRGLDNPNDEHVQKTKKAQTKPGHKHLQAKAYPINID